MSLSQPHGCSSRPQQRACRNPVPQVTPISSSINTLREGNGARYLCDLVSGTVMNRRALPQWFEARCYIGSKKPPLFDESDPHLPSPCFWQFANLHFSCFPQSLKMVSSHVAGFICYGDLSLFVVLEPSAVSRTQETSYYLQESKLGILVVIFIF